MNKVILLRTPEIWTLSLSHTAINTKPTKQKSENGKHPLLFLHSFSHFPLFCKLYIFPGYATIPVIGNKQLKTQDSSVYLIDCLPISYPINMY